MQDEGEGPLPRLLFQDRGHVVVGRARVDDQRQPGFARGGNVGAEALRLRLARGVVVMIVEAGLADRHHLRVGGKAHQLGRGDVQFFRRIVRMGADRAIDLVERFRDFKNLWKLPDPGRDRHHAPDPGSEGAGDDGLPLLGEIGEVEVAVAVDQHQAFPSACST